MDSTSNLAHCIYVSSAARLLTDEEIRELLVQCRTINQELGITGMLVYSEGSFMQVIEGEREVLEEVMTRIERDNRHKSLIRLVFEPISKRAFGDWTMGFANATQTDLAAIPGCNDFFTEGQCLSDVDAGRAKILLEVFRKHN